ncbi:hypothetical protein [Lactococcus lactis]|uniref:hypothetical protein n=1 Tax=Lactococcus lactis TaxID=1358 RepID=UPI0020739BE2|nr:hypothetical protein [Lactococcus lactis]
MPTEFIGILLEYFLDDPTAESPQFLVEYSNETHAEFLIRFKNGIDEKQENEINLDQVELETKVFNYMKKQSESFFDEFIEEQKILFAAPQKDKAIMLTQKEEKVSKEINQIALQAQKDFQLLNTLFKKAAITCLLPIEKLKQFLRMIPYFHERSLEEILYIYLQEQRATSLNESSNLLGILSKNQPMVLLPSEPTKENEEKLLIYYRASVSNKELKIKIKDKETFNYLFSQLIRKTTNSIEKGVPNQKRFEYLAVCYAYGVRENTISVFEKNNFFLDETNEKLLELSLQNILNEIHLIQEKLSRNDPSDSKKKKTSQDLLHEKLDNAEKEQIK